MTVLSSKRGTETTVKRFPRAKRKEEAAKTSTATAATAATAATLTPPVYSLKQPGQTARTSPSAATRSRTPPRPWSTCVSRPRERSPRRRPSDRPPPTSRRRRRRFARRSRKLWRRAREGRRSPGRPQRWCWLLRAKRDEFEWEAHAREREVSEPLSLFFFLHATTPSLSLLFLCGCFIRFDFVLPKCKIAVFLCAHAFPSSLVKKWKRKK